MEVDRLASMRVFCAVVEEGAFARAARRLRLSNAAVSKHVAALEEALGARLLHRTTRRLALSSAGEAYYARAARVLEELEQLERDIRDEGETPRGRLRIAAPMSYGLTEIAERLPGFMLRYPEVQVDLSLTDRMVDVVEEGVDVTIRVAKDLPDSSLIATRLGPFARVVSAAPAYFDRHGVPGRPEDLTEHATIRYTRSASPGRWIFAGPEGEITVTVTGRLDVDNSLAMRAALRAGLGVALIPACVVAEDVAAGRLVTCLDDWAPEPRSVFALYPSTRHLSPKVRAFVAYFRDALSAEPALRAPPATTARAARRRP